MLRMSSCAKSVKNFFYFVSRELSTENKSTKFGKKGWAFSQPEAALTVTHPGA